MNFRSSPSVVACGNLVANQKYGEVELGVANTEFGNSIQRKAMISSEARYPFLVNPSPLLRSDWNADSTFLHKYPLRHGVNH